MKAAIIAEAPRYNITHLRRSLSPRRGKDWPGTIRGERTGEAA